MVIGTACVLAERYADLSLPYFTDLPALQTLHAAGARSSAAFEQLCQLHWELVIEYLSVFPRDDLEELVQAQPEAYLANGSDVLKIIADPLSKRGTWRSGMAG